VKIITGTQNPLSSRHQSTQNVVWRNQQFTSAVNWVALN